VRLLLDTYILLWWATADRRLPKNARAIIASDDNEISVSVVTFWEIMAILSIGC